MRMPGSATPASISKEKPRHTGYQNLNNPNADMDDLDAVPMAQMSANPTDDALDFLDHVADVPRLPTITPILIKNYPSSLRDCYRPCKYIATLTGAATGALATYHPTLVMQLSLSSLYGFGCGAISAASFSRCGKTPVAWPKTKIIVTGACTAVATDVLVMLTENYLPTWAPPLLIATTVVLADVLPKSWKNFTFWRKNEVKSSPVVDLNDIELNETDSSLSDIYNVYLGQERSLHGGT